MATILRVKRKNTESPMDMLMLSCKRQRTDSFSTESESPIEAIVEFAGTFTDPTEDVVQHIAQILPKTDMEKVRTGVKRTYEEDPPCASQNLHRVKIRNAEKGRYQVVNRQRSQDTNAQTSENKSMTVIDAVDFRGISNSESDQTDDEDVKNYVYDLYYVQDEDGISFENGEIFIHEPEYLVYDNDDESDDDTSNSNAESNWRNDYPDTDPDGRFAYEEGDHSSEDNKENMYDSHDTDEFDCEEEEYESKPVQDTDVLTLMASMGLLDSKRISNLLDDEEESSDNEEESSDNESPSEPSDSQLL